ncbi:MAG: hypothetical protein H0X47_09820 [Nitrospirales bacterium]|nr:hypothetical protein [Nitrospirales bacterium]
MNRAFITFLIAIFAVPYSFAGEPPEWFYKAIKVSNANELAYFIEMNDSCPFTKDEVNKIAEGVLIRSRIKPLKEEIFVSGRIYLRLGISCVKWNDSSQVFSINSEFGRYIPEPGIIFDYSFGFIGIGSKDYIEQNFKSSTESAVTAFMKANFNL